MTKRERLIEYINTGCNANEQIAIHNAYCTECNCMDDYIYSMFDFNELLNYSEPIDLACMVAYGDFNPGHDWFGFDGRGNLVSYYAWELPIFASDIADYILSEENSLGNDEIENILNDEMEEN